MTTKTPFVFQFEAATVMASKDRFGLHDEMGIGKTGTTVSAINQSLGSRGIIVCPAMLRENWVNEIRAFSEYDLRICKAKTIHDYIAWQRGRFDVLVAGYELMTKWMPHVHKQQEYIDFLAFDEAHYLKNEAAGRTVALLGPDADCGAKSLVQYAEHTWHVTGTPMSNDPLDIYTFLKMAKAIDMDSKTFVDYFFERTNTAYGFRHTVKLYMVEVLQKLISNNSIRRTHHDVGMWLPPIFLTEVLIEGSTIDINEALSGYPNLEDIIISAIEEGKIELLNAAHIAMVRRLVGKAKAVSYAQMLKAELDAGAGKRVVFCHHTEPLLYVANYLTRHGYKCFTVYGDTKEKDRQDAVQQFMNDPNCDVFLGNIKVAGVGLTLTESCEIDMLESDWSPSGNAQAIKRVHRYGQTNTVRARFITLANSIDVSVNKIVAGKTAAIAEIEGHRMAAAPPLDTAFAAS